MCSHTSGFVLGPTARSVLFIAFLAPLDLVLLAATGCRLTFSTKLASARTNQEEKSVSVLNAENFFITFGENSTEAQRERSEIASEALLRHAANGELFAKEALLDLYYDTAFKMASNLLRDRGEAEAVIASVFIEIFRDASLFNPNQESVRELFIRYTLYRSQFRLKQIQVNRPHDDPNVAVAEVQAPDPPFAQVHWGQLKIREWRLIMLNAFENLNDVERLLIVCCYFGGSQIEQMAVELKKDFSFVRTTYADALRKLFDKARQHLENRTKPT